MQRFLELFRLDEQTTILDVGGLPRFWTGVPIQAQITILNLCPLDEYDASFMTPNQKAVTGDGTCLAYADRQFDIVFSNSVIEHLGTAERQAAFAREAMRVGKGYWIQTPAKECLVEPHYLTPFIHWFSKRVQRRLLRNFSLWGWLGRPSEAQLDLVLAELRLLNRCEFERLFPESHVWVERTLGLPKSYTAYKLPQAEASPVRTQAHFPFEAAR